MSRRKAMTASCGHTDRGPKPRKDWSAVVGRCGPGERARIEKGRGRSAQSWPRARWLDTSGVGFPD
jgi:hypothetical protein